MFYQHGINKSYKQVHNFNCVLCENKYETQKELNGHIAQDHSGFKFTCCYCQKQYRSANGCAKHENSHKGYDFKCEFCNKRFQLPRALSDHKKKHTGRDLYPCTNCSKKFTTNRAMLRHAKKHEGKGYSCDKCVKK